MDKWNDLNIKMEIKNLNFYYGNKTLNHVLKNVSLNIYRNSITALIGPSGCGKTTFLKTLNRMTDLIPETKVWGDIYLDNQSIFDINVFKLRKNVGMVFQKSNPFPKSIYENIVYGPKLFGTRNKVELDHIVKNMLYKVGLWDELKNRLNDSAFDLSGGQQQRLCIARALAVKPEILLMDEPASALDPIATTTIEELILKLKQKYTIIIVTHNMQQAARISDFTAFFYYGELIEFDKTTIIFTNPKNKKTEEYVTGRFG